MGIVKVKESKKKSKKKSIKKVNVSIQQPRYNPQVMLNVENLKLDKSEKMWYDRKKSRVNLGQVHTADMQ